MTNALIQIGLAAFGLSAMWMATGRNPRTRKWAPIVGLCGQPFWLVFTYQTAAWGLMVLSLVYSAVYVRGVIVLWRAA